MSNPDAFPAQPSLSAEGSLPHDIPDWPPEPFDCLTSRQLDMIDLASRGFTVDETVDALSVTLRLVRFDRTTSMGRLKATNTDHLVRLGCDAGLFLEPIEKPKNLRQPTDISIDVLNVFSYGHNGEYVASELGIEASAVYYRRTQVIRALGAKTFAHAIRLAWQEGFLPQAT